MKVVIIKYNAGNIQSVKFALGRLGIDPVLTDDPTEIRSADKVIFPGVGEAKSAMRYLREKGLDEVITQLKQPVLGICIGMQLMCDYSEEGDTKCLGIFPVKVNRFKSGMTHEGESLKIPHMGWNNIHFNDFPLFKGLKEDPYIYYVHSYRADLHDRFTVATSNYGETYSAALFRDNFYAVQFHPEKSGEVGAQVLRNFLEL